MDAACIAWDTAFLLPVLLSLSSSFPLFQPAPPLSPLLPMAQVCVCSSRWLSCFSCLRCCGFALLPVVLGGACSFACQGWVLVCFLPPPSPLPFFVRPACCVLPLLVLCLCCVVLRFPVVCCGWLSLFPSLLSPPPACVCVSTLADFFTADLFRLYRPMDIRQGLEGQTEVSTLCHFLLCVFSG